MRDLYRKHEWWEILALLYASYENQVLKNLAQKNAREEAEIENKIKSGKIKGIYRPNMSPKLRETIQGR